MGPNQVSTVNTATAVFVFLFHIILPRERCKMAHFHDAKSTCLTKDFP